MLALFVTSALRLWAFELEPRGDQSIPGPFCGMIEMIRAPVSAEMHVRHAEK